MFARSTVSVLSRTWRSLALAVTLGGGALVSGCAVTQAITGPDKPVSVYQQEKFQAEETFSRLVDASMDDACEAARRALLSQGYLIASGSRPGTVNGTKRFQPEGEVHVEINFNVVCVPDGRNAQISTVFVTALQDRYAIKKSASSTSIGVSALGSISLPMSSSQESMVKVASETIPAGAFYDRFFALMLRQLHDQQADKGAGAMEAPSNR